LGSSLIGYVPDQYLPVMLNVVSVWVTFIVFAPLSGQCVSYFGIDHLA